MVRTDGRTYGLATKSSRMGRLPYFLRVCGYPSVRARVEVRYEDKRITQFAIRSVFAHFIVVFSDKSVGRASNVKCMISICVLSDDVFTVGFISKQYIVRLL